MSYRLPDELPIFPLSGALLLPRGNLPLNIFEPRYLDLVDYALSSEERMIGMIQYIGEDQENGSMNNNEDREKPLALVGCAGRITVFNEINSDRYQIILNGINRFKIQSHLDYDTPFMMIRPDWSCFEKDQIEEQNIDMDRIYLLKTFREFLYAKDLDADWEGVDEANDETLINALCMMAPYGDKEKQALLEAKTLQDRTNMLMAITERALVLRKKEDHGLQ